VLDLFSYIGGWGIQAAAGGARDTLVTRGPGGEGWQLLVRYAGGGHHYPLRSRREPLRVFASLTQLERYATKIGLREFRVEL
ncbi:hypothetical protein, partial [Pseudomonas sp. S68]